MNIERENKIMKKYLQIIYDLGYDYDGCNTVEGLKGLIDELCRLAQLGRDIDDKTTIYSNEDKHYNILGEEITNE